MYALYQESKILDNRNEWGPDLAILSDSTVVIAHARSDKTSTGQRFAFAIVEECNRGSIPTLRRVPSLSDIEGNEAADEWAKNTAERIRDSILRDCLHETSFAHMAKMATDARPAGVK